MSLNGVCFSSVLNLLFTTPGILSFASAPIGRAAAAATAAAPARNVRRLRDKDLPVISDERISDGFLISIPHPTLVLTIVDTKRPEKFQISVESALPAATASAA